jgi:hypothetical protein
MRRNDKNRDMARSILPSTRRTRARHDKAAAHRRERRVSRQELELALDDDDFEWAFSSPRQSREYSAEIKNVVEERRWADKTGPFKRWAEARTRFLRSEVDRYFAIRGVLGRSTVVTDHALGHFVDIERARNPFWGSWWRPAPDERVRRWRSVSRLETLLARAIRSQHARLNALLLETGFVRACAPGDACWNVPDRKRRHDPTVCPRRALAKTPADAGRLASEIWQRISPGLAAGLEEIFRDCAREDGASRSA